MEKSYRETNLVTISGTHCNQYISILVFASDRRYLTTSNDRERLYIDRQCW